MEVIRSNPDLHKFVREQPYWYRKISRNPNELEELKLTMMNTYQKTIPHKVAQFSNSVQMAQMMMSMFYAMRQQD